MKTLITGSIAYDTIMVFPDRFRNHLLPDQLHILNVCFLTPEMRREFGGTAGNIAYNLKQLGGDPLVMATVGEDIEPYLYRLQRLHSGIGMLREGSSESRLRQVDYPLLVGREHGRLRMWRSAVEKVRNRFALVRRESSHINERPHLLGPCGPDYGPGIGVAGENDRSRHAGQRSFERRDVVAERCQRQRRRHHLDALGRQQADDLCPTRSIGPCAMGKHNSRSVR